jgi:hypothetical protein
VAKEAIHMAIAKVVNNLPSGPAAGPVREVKLAGTQSGQSFLKN